MDRLPNQFPQSNTHMLALAYVQMTADKSVSPEEFLRLYCEAFYRMSAVAAETDQKARSQHYR